MQQQESESTDTHRDLLRQAGQIPTAPIRTCSRASEITRIDASIEVAARP